MARRLTLCALVLLSGLASGCRCCPLLTTYGNVIDDVSDHHVYFDHWYHPRWDVSRAGKPDWCGPNGRRLFGRCCCEGYWGRSDECNLYPPYHPYTYPGNAMAQATSRVRHPDGVDSARQSLSPPPAPQPDPAQGDATER